MNIVAILFLSYLIISYLASSVIVITIMLENRDPARTVTWLLIFLLLPGIGLLIYAIFGRNIRKIKIFKTQKLANDIKEEKIFENLEEIQELVKLEQDSIKNKTIESEDLEDYPKKRVINLLLNTGMFPFTTNNKIDVYVDGIQKFDNLIKDIKSAKHHIHLEYFIIKDSEIGRKIKDLLIEKSKQGVGIQKFDNLIKDIKSAKHHIHLEYFIIKDSEIGRKIKDLLIEKSKQGVKIRILYDDVGCWRFWFHRKFFNEMKSYGIDIMPFLPAKFPIIGSKLNYRNHRKIVVIDGVIGYTGGINIGDEYIGKNRLYRRNKYWR